MNETIEQSISNICDKANFQRKSIFSNLLTKSLHISNDSTISTYAVHNNLILKMNTLFEGFSPIVREFGKENQYLAGVIALHATFEELGIEVDKEECFILYHMRTLGKFKIRESKLKEELTVLWKRYKEYALEDQDFSYCLKNLMRNKLIDYRKGNLQLKQSVIIRYRR
jgi:hypothetical protein